MLSDVFLPLGIKVRLAWLRCYRFRICILEFSSNESVVALPLRFRDHDRRKQQSCGKQTVRLLVAECGQAIGLVLAKL